MVSCGLLTGLVLLSLLSPVACAEIQNLAEIIKYLQTTYGNNSQFALAINVPAKQCSADVKADQNFLPEDKAQKVIADMARAQRVYRGKQLMGARPKPMPGSRNNYHSEYLLLIQSNPPHKSSDDPLVKKLLDNDTAGCVVFYTYNSPCVNTCSTPNKKYSIIPALKMFENHSGPKAFVFGQVWKHDENAGQWEVNMKEVNKRVPLYRCDNAGCTRCVEKNKVVSARCKTNKQGS